jgi:hypothetical protein
MITPSSEKLSQAIAAVQAGDRKNGRRLLAEILQADPRNESAWLWLSQIVETEERRRECLRQVLTLNPNNQAAQAALAKLQPPGVKPAAESPHIEAQKPQQPSPEVSPPSRTRLKSLSKPIKETVHYQDDSVLLSDQQIVLKGESYPITRIVSVVMEVKRASEKTYRNIMLFAVILMICPGLIFNYLYLWTRLRPVSFRTIIWFIVAGLIVWIGALIYKAQSTTYGVRVIEPNRGSIPLWSKNKDYITKIVQAINKILAARPATAVPSLGVVEPDLPTDTEAMAEGTTWQDQLRQARSHISADLLKASNAYELLCQVRDNFLQGAGDIQTYEKAGGFDQLYQLLWHGSVSAPRTPNYTTDWGFPSYISVGQRDGKLWVYNDEVSPPTPAALQAALLAAVKNPRKLHTRPLSAWQKAFVGVTTFILLILLITSCVGCGPLFRLFFLGRF